MNAAKTVMIAYSVRYMTAILDQSAELARLRTLEAQHRLTLRVLAVAIEQLLRATHSEQIMMSTHAVAHAPALSAWRDRATNGYVLTVAP